jgi:hypothetical protein
MANIHLHIEPSQAPLTWEEFIATKPPYSIALDGYVYGATKFTESKMGPYANFNHHEEVDRLSTRATCAQVLIALRQGLIDAFRKDGEVTIHVYVNDCDQDVCLSWFLLNNHIICQNTINPIINRLVHMEDMMDTCSGAYPFNMDMETLRHMAWVFEPYTNFRMNGGVDKKDVKEFEIVIKDVERRINEHIMGKSQSSILNMSFKKIGGGANWAMVIEEGFNARTAMMSVGIKAFVSVRTRQDGNFTYSIGKMSGYIPFDIPGILQFLDKKEGNDIDHWGGSNTIGGSPRVGGSKLTPLAVEIAINKFIEHGAREFQKVV